MSAEKRTVHAVATMTAHETLCGQVYAGEVRAISLQHSGKRMLGYSMPRVKNVTCGGCRRAMARVGKEISAAVAP